ncbi:MAG TPA: hypothetical protein VFS71_17285, partial [Flavobacterium sp.]|uniref:beta strand repeat-containing protein n=1 Tax=Flavobacterium sp. TaxID=239 RepID=UPI002DB85F49
MNTKFIMTKNIAFITLLLVMSFTKVMGQTPGLIYQPATGSGKLVLDPNGDGYVSATTAGFTTDDQLQSEIPYNSLVFPMVEPNSDLSSGPSCSFTDFVDQGDQDPVQSYLDSNGNWLFRMRMGTTAPNSKSYSILIDTDGKFGSSGPNADPQYSSSNPGFEIEIVLATNFGVYIYNVNSTSGCSLVKSYVGTTNYQKSVALTTSCGNPDYFYDFFVQMSDLSFGMTSATPVRMAMVDNMGAEKSTVCNPASASDIAGIDSSCGSLENCFGVIVDNYTPCPPGQVCQDRSTCPIINGPIYTDNSTITGTSTEASGTNITVSVYASDGTTLVRSGTTTTTGTTWTINISSLSPSGTLTTGQIVRAKATANGKGASIDNCSEKTVLGAPCTTAAPTSITTANSGKDIVVGYASLTGVVTVNVYNANGTVWQSFTSGNVTSSQATLSGGSPITSNGSKVPDGTYYATITFGGCTSPPLEQCIGSNIAAAPTVTSPISTGATTVAGTGLVGYNVIVYADGVKIGTVNNLASTSWSVTVPALTKCQVITAKQNRVSINNASDTGNCNSPASTSVTVSKTAATPVITTYSCVASPYVITGTSTENGGTITLYQPNSAGTAVGTGIVSGGSWSIVPSVSSGTIVAKVTSGACLTSSLDSAPVTYSRQPSIAAYTIGITNPVEGQTSVSGTISGGTYPVTVTLYQDGSAIVNSSSVPYTAVVSAAGAWTINGLSSTDLYLGGVIQISLTGTGCESGLSTTTATVQCTPPILQTYTGGSKSYCNGSAGSISLNSSESGVLYELVNGAGTTVGPSTVGTGSAITLSTNALTANLTNLYVKAYKILNTSCSITSTVAINFDTQSPSPTVTFPSTALSVQQGITTLNLPYSARSASPLADRYTIDYSIAANNQGFVDVTSPATISSNSGNIILSIPVAAALGSYTGTITVTNSSGGSCISAYSFSVAVFGASSPPVISVNPSNVSICSGTPTILNVTASGSGTLNYQWQEASSFGGPYGPVVGGSGAASASYTTPALTLTKYYRVLVSNTPSTGTTTSNVATVTVNSPIAQTITGTTPICVGGSATWTSTTSGGSWSSATPAVATVDAVTGLINGLSAGTSVITYSVTVGGCVNTANKTVTITPTVGTPV